MYELRNEKGYSFATLSKKSGVAAFHIQRIEAGECKPTVDRLEKLCVGLGITMMDFFNEDNIKLTVDMIEFINRVKKLSSEQIKAFNVILSALDK